MLPAWVLQRSVAYARAAGTINIVVGGDVDPPGNGSGGLTFTADSNIDNAGSVFSGTGDQTGGVSTNGRRARGIQVA